VGIGAAHLEVLGPPGRFHGTRSDPNNSSLVMRAEVHGVRILLSGDAEVEAQQQLVDHGVDLRADVLKVWHHGSAYFDPDFVTAVAARTAIISVGAHNDYGHPSPLALQALARAGMSVHRTDQDGDVAVAMRAGGLSVVTRGPASSAVALRRAVRRGATVHGVLSEPDARMPVCRPVPSVPRIFPARCPAQSCSSETRSCWWTAPSARSPPPSVPLSLQWSRPTSSAARSRGRS
jgi:competence protein ComEC